LSAIVSVGQEGARQHALNLQLRVYTQRHGAFVLLVRLFLGAIFHSVETRLPSRLYKLSKGIFGQTHTFDKLASWEPPLCHQRRFLYYSSTLNIKCTTLLQALQQLWLKELADGDILCQTLPSSCLEHEVSRKCLCGRRLERSQRDVPVEWVSRYDGPAIEDER
jgi:hypothetical protein